jgi:predicted SAM-dependent methyltransferase
MKLKNIPFIYELGLKVKHSYWMVKTRKEVEKYLQTPGEKKMQLGAGQNKLDKWLNTDYFPRNEIFFLDATSKIPAPSNSFDYVFSEHHIEHIHYKDAKFMASEICRILKPGGVFRVCTPDLKVYLNAYSAPDPMKNQYVQETLEDWIKSGFYNAKNYIPSDNEANVSFFINDIFLNYEHKFIYDSQTLEKLLINTGFSKAQQSIAGKSSYEVFQNIEAHAPTVYTLVVEGIK